MYESELGPALVPGNDIRPTPGARIGDPKSSRCRQSYASFLRSMNTLEQQARSFFLRCRARPWQPRTHRPSGRCRHAVAHSTFVTEASRASKSELIDKSPPKKPYYVTTPIYYVNAEPHIGHLYSLVLADVLKRYADLKSRPDVRATLLTGTDEHGQKVQRAAEKAQTETSAFCAMQARHFMNLANKANISYDRFIRTTDEDHKAAVEHFFLQLQHRGFIYQSKHEGWYCVSDETFYPESQIHLVIEPQTGRKMYASKETGKEVQWTSEDNYHFRLSAFQERLLKLYEDNPQFIVPRQRMNFIISEVESGLSDLSVSRPSARLPWGIRVPEDKSQTIYVWLDALINYITMAGYPFVSKHPNEAIWPPNCQVIGKDIIRFHTIYWPAFLMALDLPVPKQFLCHAHWTMNQEKMSKSIGNVVNPFHAMDRFGVDTIRYYMIRDGGYADDSAYENQFIIDRYKKELQGGLGNMLSRILRGKRWNLLECVQRVQSARQNRQDLPEPFQSLRMNNLMILRRADQAMAEANPRAALACIMEIVKTVNRDFQASEVWHKAASTDQKDQDEVKGIIYASADCLRVAMILLQPFMPEKMKVGLDMLGVRDEARHWGRARIGYDLKYGEPMISVGKNDIGGTLFPPLTSQY